MTRPLFDPTQAKGAAPAKQEAVYSPSGLTQKLKDVLAAGFPGKVKVRGEVSNLRDRNHWYFDLKDADAVVNCVAWASTARKIRVDVHDGVEVIVTGRVDFYGPQGKLQLYVDQVEAVGRGALEAELKKRAAELQQLGYFDPASKQALPTMPRSIAVVTSRSAAALQDVIDTAQRRWPGVRLALFDVRVQGEAAAAEIANALKVIGKSGRAAGIEAVILTRGGGSIEDLWAFNERAVCDAVFRCPLPVVAAIGHETDITLAELCADARAATPTQAATLLVPEADAQRQQLDQLTHRLRVVLKRRSDFARHRLDTAARHPLFRQPQRLVDDQRERLEAAARRLRRAILSRRPEPEDLSEIQRRLNRAVERRLRAQRDRLAAAARQLHAVSPARVLDRGFSYTLGEDGKLVRSVKQAPPGASITTVLSDGQVASTVKGKPKAGRYTLFD